ncbi:MAG: TraR/DksA family transcriptional regulator [Burkholderiales bacterium]|nr:TraR/DksA family transcriptional regulator [Burkholderiales bacterium]
MTSPTAADLKALETQLQLRRTVLLTELREQLHRNDETDTLALINHFDETGDWVEADIENDIDIALLNRKVSALRDIDAALARLRANWDGSCANCGESIAWERLQANPTAQICVNCQTALEKRQGGNIAVAL